MKDLTDGEEKAALEPPYEDSKMHKTAILKYFVLTEKSDDKNCPRMLRKKLQGGNKQHFKVRFGRLF